MRCVNRDCGTVYDERCSAAEFLDLTWKFVLCYQCAKFRVIARFTNHAGHFRHPICDCPGLMGSALTYPYATAN
jgi:hypothetical protein